MTSGGAPVPPSPAGLCASCAHARIITSARGSVFYLCELSVTQAAFARYPVLPVLACGGYHPREDRAEQP